MFEPNAVISAPLPEHEPLRGIDCIVHKDDLHSFNQLNSSVVIRVLTADGATHSLKIGELDLFPDADELPAERYPNPNSILDAKTIPENGYPLFIRVENNEPYMGRTGWVRGLTRAEALKAWKEGYDTLNMRMSVVFIQKDDFVSLGHMHPSCLIPLDDREDDAIQDSYDSWLSASASTVWNDLAFDGRNPEKGPQKREKDNWWDLNVDTNERIRFIDWARYYSTNLLEQVEWISNELRMMTPSAKDDTNQSNIKGRSFDAMVTVGSHAIMNHSKSFLAIYPIATALPHELHLIPQAQEWYTAYLRWKQNRE